MHKQIRTNRPKHNAKDDRKDFNRSLLCDKKSQNGLIHSVNTRLLKLRSEIDEVCKRTFVPDFGSGIYRADGSSCVFYNTNTIVAATIADRIKSKFECPDLSNRKQLTAECMDKWVSFEQEHLRDFEFENLSGPARGDVYRVAQLVKDWLLPRNAHQKNFWAYIEEAPIDFGPGESYSPNEGDTSTFSKLNSINIFPNWTVTVEYAVNAAYLVAANKPLRAQAKEFLRKPKYPSPRQQIWIDEATEMWNRLKHDHVSKRVSYFAKLVFIHIIYAYPVDHSHSLVKRGSRGSSVYKNVDVRRFIEIQCFLNVIGQKICGYGFRMCLKHNAKIDLDDGQQYHRWLVTQPNVSTLDEKSASDSNLYSSCRRILPPSIFPFVSLTRAHFILLSTRSVNGNGNWEQSKDWYPVRKLSSMGNGYTFEYLSLVLGAASRLHDPTASVYGDDIICRDAAADAITETITAIGFLVNEKKSFVQKPLRESCGSFYLEGYGVITCFDIKWCHNLNDVINQVNKLGRIVRFNQTWEHLIREKIECAYADLRALIPAFLRGPEMEGSDLPLWVEDPTYLKKHKASSLCKEKIKPYWTTCRSLSGHWQLDRASHSYGSPINFQDEWAVVLVPSIKPAVRVKARHAGVIDKSALFYAYIHSGRVVDMQIRLQKEEQTWAFKPTLVHSSGVSLRAGSARRICKEFDLNAYKKSVLKENIRQMKISNKYSSRVLPG